MVLMMCHFEQSPLITSGLNESFKVKYVH